ncbi:hypothetical protein DNTS_030473, partial [Danionella cerebrum]
MEFPSNKTTGLNMASFVATIQEISRMKRDEGLARLSSCFLWTEFNGDDKRQFVHQEFVYENVMFAITRGFSWSTVAQVANITKELLPKFKGLRSSEVVALVRDALSQIEPRLSSAHLAVLLDSFLKSYVPHQHLYQAFLTGMSGLTPIRLDLEIMTPPQPMPLTEGTDVHQKKQQEIVNKLYVSQSRAEAELQILRETSKQMIMATLQEGLDSLPHEGHMSKKEVEELIQSFLQMQGEIMMESLMKETDLSEKLLQIKLSQSEIQTQLTNHPSDYLQRE